MAARSRIVLLLVTLSLVAALMGVGDAARVLAEEKKPEPKEPKEPSEPHPKDEEGNFDRVYKLDSTKAGAEVKEDKDAAADGDRKLLWNDNIFADRAEEQHDEQAVFEHTSKLSSSSGDGDNGMDSADDGAVDRRRLLQKTDPKEPKEPKEAREVEETASVAFERLNKFGKVEGKDAAADGDDDRRRLLHQGDKHTGEDGTADGDGDDRRRRV